MLLYFQRKDLKKDLGDTSADRAKFSKKSDLSNNTPMLNQYF